MIVERKNFPDFFIAGAPKCGTTSLYHWLNKHPGTYMPVKEPSFFSQDIRTVPESTLAEYQFFFDNPPASNLLIGEASPKYLYCPSGLRQIYKYNPHSKILILLRPPVDLVFSYHGQMIREGLEPVRDFEQAWLLSENRQNGQDVPKNCPWPKVLDYPNWGAVGTRLQELLRIFPQKNVKVFLLEQLADNAEKVYQETLEFLGLPEAKQPCFNTHNQRAAIKSIKIHQAILGVRQSLIPALEYLHKIRGGKGIGVLKLINLFNQIPGERQYVPDKDFYKELHQYFSPEIKLVEDITGLKLPHWYV